MRSTDTSRIVRLATLAVLAAAPPLAGQRPPQAVVSRDSVVIAPGPRYDANSLQRVFLGNTYRDLWIAPVRVPVLPLRTYAGGLRPLKAGGGKQTKTLRFSTPDGSEYVFRVLDKASINTPERYKGTLVDKIFRDQVSALFPAASLVAAPIVGAAGVLHVTPTFTVLPNDTLLGEFREDYIRRLGMIEEYPTKPDDAPGFAGALEIVDSEDLMPLLDRDPTQSIDARAFLTARLTDMLLGDNDRHHGNWKWARFANGRTTRWIPIPRDRDHAFHHYDGLLARIASFVAPNLTRFESRYPGISGLSRNSREVDQRLLAGLEKPVWDSVAAALVQRITDAVIDSGMRRAPAEYRPRTSSLASKLKRRRDALPDVSNRFYRTLARMVDVHATDTTDVATVTRLDGGMVEVRLQSGREAPYFTRRFDPRETAEIRVYLHDGDDVAVVRGEAAAGIPVRIIGGNGTNQLVDSSRVRSGRARARFYDVGRVTGISYGPDSLRDTLFDRRPWIKDTGAVVPPGPDYGSRLRPTGGFGGGSGLGFVPQLGLRWTRYGFRRQPYSSRVELEGEYSTSVGGFRLTLMGDKRFESSRLHVMGTARMSDFEVINFYGFGNDTEGEPEDFFEVRQRQWMFHPTIGWDLGRPESDFTIGPVVQVSTTDSTAERFIAAERPYGFGDFGQAGLRAGFRYDTRDHENYARRGFLLDLGGGYFPAVWDVERAFTQVGGSAATYLELPVPTRPILALRAGGRKVFGDSVPFHEAAFIGGRGTVRGMDAQRYAGDASVYGTTELRVPLGRVPFILPFDVGLFGFADAGRVYVDGDSPGGWHSVLGGGLWLGILDPGTGFSIALTNSSEKRILLGTGLKF